ncbi:MAG: DNA pilot protein [Microvirus sp.]|nr:MAG: DNA pilot protein [Microvirus sp.]
MGFDPLDIITPGLDAISGIINAKQARDAFKSRYQDTVRDMKKAGLNPALAYGQGGGNPQTHDIPDLGKSVAGAVGTAASAGQAAANMELTKAQTKLLNAQSQALAVKPTLENQLLGQDINLRGQDVNLRQKDVELRGAQVTQTGVQTAAEAKRIDQMDTAIAASKQDQAWIAASWDTRIGILAAQLQKAGLEVTEQTLKNAVLRAELPKAQIIGGAATGAKKVLNDLVNGPGENYTQEASGAMKDIFNRINHWVQQHGGWTGQGGKK